MLQPFGKPFCCRVGVPLVVLESSIRVAAKHQMYLYFYKVPLQRLVLFQASDVECGHHPYKLPSVDRRAPPIYTSFHYPMINCRHIILQALFLTPPMLPRRYI